MMSKEPKEFNKLEFEPHPVWHNGIQAKLFFNNGYGVSVVRGEHSYGGTSGLYELAVLKGTKESWRLCYDTPITNDVLGYLTEADVLKFLIEIAAFPDIS